MTARWTPARLPILVLAVIALLLAPSGFASSGRAPAAGETYVVHVSVDGLRGDAVRRMGPAALPHFWRLMIEGAFTENARSDCDYTVTLPNHACELTSRPVSGPDGHGLNYNTDDGRTLAQIHGSYVAGVFDVVHDAGLPTGMYTSKSKFALFDRSWDAVNGAPDTTGADDGRDKIDTYLLNGDTNALVTSLCAAMAASPYRYAFLHLTDLDTAGHAEGWESADYVGALLKIDGLVGRILDCIEGSGILAGNAYLLVAADHGGTVTDHGNAALAANYTIPLYVWGPGIPAGADLYQLNPFNRQNPGAAWLPCSGPAPIRNGETGNLALDLLGLPRIPGSVIDAAQDLETFFPGGPGALPSVSIASPLPGASFVYPATVPVVASAGPAAEIVRVEFFENSIPVAVDSTYPYSCEMTGYPTGPYRITARALRENGAASTASVEIAVTSTAGDGGMGMPSPSPRVYPNPCERLTTFEFSLAEGGPVDVGIYDALGRRLDTLFAGELGAGYHTLPVEAASYAPGVYFVSLRAGAQLATRKLMIVR